MPDQKWKFLGPCSDRSWPETTAFSRKAMNPRQRVQEILVWLKTEGGFAQDSLSWRRSNRLDLHRRCYRLQPGQDAQPEPVTT